MGDAEFNLTEKQDPMSHRIIEKRRRDRMNNCLADLSRLIPPDYLKKGRGRIEKTEIIEMAIRHLKYLQDKLNCIQQQEVVSSSVSTKHFRLGYQECLAEVIHYMVEGQNTISSESKSVQLITHLHRHCDQIMKGELSNKHRPTPESSSSSSGSSGHYTLSNQTSDSHSSQRVNEKTLAIVKKKLHNKHSDRYNSDKQYNSIQGMEVMQRLNKQMLDSQSSESNIDDLRTMYSQNNMGQLPLINDDNFAGDNNEERRENSLAQNKDVLPNDCQTTEDHRLSNTYSPLLIDYRGPESNLRSIRKADSSQTCDSGLSNTTDPDNIHSYKFKNNIQQRFSESLITDYCSSSPSEAMTGSSCSSGNKKEQFEFNSKVAHKRRKPNSEHHTRYTSTSYHQYRDQQLSSSETNSSENITSVSQNSAYRHDQLQESKIQSATSSKEASQSAADNRRCQFPEKFEKFNSLGVPIFALHASRSFYVPMSIDYETLLPFLGPYDLTDMSSLQPNTTFYPVTINVNFQPLGNRHLQMIRKREDISDWQ